MPTIREEQFLNFNADVILAPLTGFTSASGTVASTDTLLQGFNKLDGNVGLKVPKTTTVAGFALTSNVTLANLTASAGIAGGSYNGSTTVNWTLDVNNANTWTALQTFGNNISIGGVTSTGAIGTGNNVFSISPTFTGTPLSTTGVLGDTTAQIATNAFVNANSTAGEPNYFYPGSLFKQTRVNIALNAALPLQGSTQLPIHITFIGDSRAGIAPGYILDAIAQYGKLNSIGFIAPYSNIYGSAVTWVQTGAVTRNDNTSAATFGIAGSRLDLTGTQSWSVQPAARYPADKIRIYYNKTVGGGTFNWSIDGGATTGVNTDPGSGGDTLGVVTISSGLETQGAHTVLIANVSGSSRIYGMDFQQQAQSGFIVDILQSGSSQVSNWTANMSYTASYIATISPAVAVIWFDVNDAISSVSSATYMTNIRALVTGLALPATSSPVFLTYLAKQTATGSGLSDTVPNGLMAQYRTSLLAGVASDGWSVIDAFTADPSIAYMNTNGMYLDDRHYAITAAPYRWNTVVRSVMPYLVNPDTTNLYPKFLKASNLIAPNGTVGFGMATESGVGGLTETNTGWYGVISNGTNVMKYQGAGSELLRMGSNGATNTTIMTLFSTSTYTKAIEIFRQGSTSADAFSISTDGSNNTLFNTNNGNLNITATTLAQTGKLTVSSSSTFGGTTAANGWGTAGIQSNFVAATWTDSNSALTQANAMFNTFQQPTLAATLNTGVSTGTITTPGTLYTNGTYTTVSLTGGTGSGAKATIIVAGAVVTTVTITTAGTGYAVNDTLSAAAANIGGTGSGFVYTVNTLGVIYTNAATVYIANAPAVSTGVVASNLWALMVGTGNVSIAGTTFSGSFSATSGNAFYSSGTFATSGIAVRSTDAAGQTAGGVEIGAVQTYSRVLMNGGSAATPVANNPMTNLIVGNSGGVTLPATGTTPGIYQVYIKAIPTITNGSVITLTETANLKVEAEGSGGTTNFGIISAGKTSLVGAVTLGSTINKLTITAPTTSSTLTVIDGSSLITAGAFALTLTSTATTNATFPAGTGTLAYLGGVNTWTGVQVLTNPIEKTTLATVNASATLTAAQMQTGWKTTSSIAVALTTVTATALATQLGVASGGFEANFTVDNSASTASGVITITLAAGFTVMTAITGENTLTIATGTCAKYDIIFTSSTTAFIGRAL